MVPTGQPSVQVISKQKTDIYTAADVSGTKITNIPMTFLINGNTASAAEIFVASSKEYAPHALVIGQKSYGKGTVQTIISYSDGSLLKYTIAKRYTGKNKINVDKKGITPDIPISKAGSGTQDTAVQYALKYGSK